MEARKRKLALDLRRGKTLGAALDDEAADLAVELRPHHRDVGHRRIGDPHFRAVEFEAARHLLGAGDHRAGVGAVVGLSEPEAADHRAGRELGQIFAPLRFAAIGVDRMHHERGLHRHGRAITGIDALDLARDQAVGHIAEACAAVFLRDCGAKQPERAHFEDHGRIVALVVIGLEHAGKQLLLRIVARGVAHHALFLGEFAFEVERVFPVESRVLDRGGLAVALFRRLRHELLLENVRHPEAPARSAGLEGRRPPRLGRILRGPRCGRLRMTVGCQGFPIGAADGCGKRPRRGRCCNTAYPLFKPQSRFIAPVAQLDRALPSEGKGQRFESSRARHFLSIINRRS